MFSPWSHPRVDYMSPLMAGYIYNKLFIRCEGHLLSSVSQSAIKESEGPFPWPVPLGRGRSGTATGDGLAAGNGQGLGGLSSSLCPPVAPSVPEWLAHLPLELQGNKRLLNIADESAAMPCIALLYLPRPNLCAGRVLEHCVKTVERIYNKWDPVIFKIGWTHDPCWRWKNDLYGYCRAKEKWSNMTILHISHEPYSTSMLEAALILYFKCI